MRRITTTAALAAAPMEGICVNASAATISEIRTIRSLICLGPPHMASLPGIRNTAYRGRYHMAHPGAVWPMAWYTSRTVAFALSTAVFAFCTVSSLTSRKTLSPNRASADGTSLACSLG